MADVEVKLPSGAELKVTLSEFDVADDLLKAYASAIKGMRISADDELDFNLFKDIITTGISDKDIQKHLWKCAERASYNGVRIDRNTFQPAEARQDYLPAMFEIGKANLYPFLKGLFAKYAPLVEKVLNALASRPETTGS